jgi:hypothetical protein
LRHVDTSGAVGARSLSITDVHAGSVNAYEAAAEYLSTSTIAVLGTVDPNVVEAALTSGALTT